MIARSAGKSTDTKCRFQRDCEPQIHSKRLRETLIKCHRRAWTTGYTGVHGGTQGLNQTFLRVREDGSSPACKVQQFCLELDRMCSSGIVVRKREMRCEGPKDFLSLSC